MTQELKVALFVEGAEGIPDRTRVDPLEYLWLEVIAKYVGLRRIERVIPISKVELTMMDPGNPPKSTGREPFDARLARELKRAPFDSAVVVWDLLPPWAGAHAVRCRWMETKDLFCWLGNSKVDALPEEWKTKARARFESYNARSTPSDGATRPILERYSVLPVCIEADFEALLMVNESVIREALGVDGPVRDWPKWPREVETRTQMQKEVLQRAITSARSSNPKLPVFRKHRGDMRTNAHDWAAHFFEALFNDSRSRSKLLEHPIVNRLQSVLGGHNTEAP